MEPIPEVTVAGPRIGDVVIRRAAPPDRTARRDTSDD
jgi:hypothetical protein